MTKLKVTTPAELISAVPFLIGFHPADSLIVVAMRGALIAFAVRIDLPEDSTPEQEARAAVLHLATVVLRQQVEAVTIIGYGAESRVTPAVLRISAAFRKEHLTVVDELRVTDGRYWSYLCTDSTCCPAEGRPCEPAHSVVAAEATFAGAVALPDREALSAQLAPVTGDDREAMTAATARAVLRLAGLAAERPATGPSSDDSGDGPSAADDLPAAGDGGLAGPHPPTGRDTGDLRFHDRKTPDVAAPGAAELHLGGVIWAKLGLAVPTPESKPANDQDRDRDATADADKPELLSDEDYFFALIRTAGRSAIRAAERCYSTGGRLPDDDVAWLGVLLLHVPVRDYAWTRTGTEEWELKLWSDVMRRVEARYLPAAAGLLAFVAWRMGQGALASVAVERALEQKPDYSLGLLMRGVLSVGLPPSVVDGWPAVAGLSLVAYCAEAEADQDQEQDVDRRGGSGKAGRADAAPLVGREETRAGRDPRTAQNPGRLPVQLRPGASAAAPRGGAGERRDRPGRQRQSPRRATQRRL
jgi:hypothetical protein